MPALQRTLSSRRNSRTSEETTVGANGVHCPWGMEQFDVSSLPDQPMSTFVPLTYNPDAQLAKKGTKRMPVALRKVVNRLARSSSDEVGPYGPLAADAPVQRLPAGWLNVFGVGSEENEYGVALPSDAQESKTQRFPRPDFGAPPPIVRPVIGAGTDSVGLQASDASRRVNDSSTHPLSGLSNMSIAAPSNRSIGQSTTSLYGGVTGPSTEPKWSGGSINLVHPIYRRQQQEGAWSGHSYATHAYTSEGTTDQRSMGVESGETSSQSLTAGYAYVPNLSTAGAPGGGLSLPAQGRTGPPLDLMRGGNPSTIPEETTEEARDDHTQDDRSAALRTTGGAAPPPPLPKPALDASLQMPDLPAQELVVLVEAREAEAAAAADGGEGQGRLDKASQALGTMQNLGLAQQLLGQYEVSASSEVRRGANSVIVTGLSAIDSELYCIKFFGQAEALAAEEAMLGHRDLALVLPPARYVDSKEHKQALQGPVMVSRPGKALDLLLSDDPHLLSSPVTLVQFATRLCLLLDTLHRHKRNHGNLSPHHIVADLEHTPMLFTLVDMSCSRHFHEQDHLPWGTFDVRYAAPQVVALSLACASAPFAAPSDLWSMGIVLFEVAAGREYWLGYNQLEMKDIVAGLLQRDAKVRLTVLDAVAALSELLQRRPLEEDTITDGDAQRFLTRNFAKLTAPPLATDDADAVRRQLNTMHQILSGQDVLISIQLWQEVPGRLGCRQLCPLAARHEAERRAGASKPVFQLVTERNYFLAFFVQNRDLASTKRLPFSDVIEVRIGVGEQGDSRYLKPQVRESGSQLWWGEVPWLPSSIENSLCQDIGATSIDKPGTLWVSLLLAVPHMSAPMRVQQALHFNFSANGSHAGAATSAPVDLLRNPALAKKEMVRSGVAFGARIGSNAFAFLPL